MPDNTVLTILAALCAGLLFFVLLLLMGIRSSLGKLERSFAAKKPEAAPATQPSPARPADATAGSAFDAFLKEDPSRLELSKKEQSAAYRKWRQEHGMNWTNS